MSRDTPAPFLPGRESREQTDKNALVLLAVVSLGLLIACGGGESGSDGEFTPTCSSFLTEEHPASVAGEAWMMEVTERTNRAVTFETFCNGS